MTSLDPSPTVRQGFPPWLDWVLSNTPSGLVLLDGQGRVEFANKWFLQRARWAMSDVYGRTLVEIFPVLRNSHFGRALTGCMRTGFPAVLSQTLHPSPFPLYAPGVQLSPDNLLRQSISIVPMGPADAAAAGQRYTLIQVADVSPNVARERVLKAQADRISGLVHVDALTGIGNRRFFDDVMASELRSAYRSGNPLGLIMLDIDHFKEYNDLYGHPAGDRCLQAVAQVLKTACRRPRDVVARYGGEEMAVVLPDTEQAGAVQLARDILHRVREQALPHAGSGTAPVLTLTAGVWAGRPSPADVVEGPVHRADKALYAAKNAGRDCVYVFDAQSNLTQPV